MSEGQHGPPFALVCPARPPQTPRNSGAPSASHGEASRAQRRGEAQPHPGEAGTRVSWPCLAISEAGVCKDADSETHLWGRPEPSLHPWSSGPVCGEPVTPGRPLRTGPSFPNALLWACWQGVLSPEWPPLPPRGLGTAKSQHPGQEGLLCFPLVLCPREAGAAFPVCHLGAPCPCRRAPGHPALQLVAKWLRSLLLLGRPSAPCMPLAGPSYPRDPLPSLSALSTAPWPGHLPNVFHLLP